jgi:hypothetical protein
VKSIDRRHRLSEAMTCSPGNLGSVHLIPCQKAADII